MLIHTVREDLEMLYVADWDVGNILKVNKTKW